MDITALGRFAPVPRAVFAGVAVVVASRCYRLLSGVAVAAKMALLVAHWELMPRCFDRQQQLSSSSVESVK